MTDIQKYIYKFMDLNGKQSVLTFDQKLDEKCLYRYKAALGTGVTHTVEPLNNDIARPVVVEPSREYDAQAALIEALEAEVEAMTLERDQLAARVVELESEVCWNRKRNDKHGMTNFEDGVGGGSTSALLIRDADLLEGIAQEWDEECGAVGCKSVYADELMKRSLALRNQSQEKSK